MRFRQGRLAVKAMSEKMTDLAVIFDMDGTLADTSSILEYVIGPKRDLFRFHTESIDIPPNHDIADLARMVHFCTPYHVLIMTARTEDFAPHTIIWLHENGIPYTDVFFRPSGDSRKDFVVKKEMLTDWILPIYTPFLAIDDNPAIISMMEECGIPTIQVPGFYVD